MSTEQVALKKGKANFTIIGQAKINDFTFKDNTYESGWTDRQMNLNVDCGNGNTVFVEMSGGYFPNGNNVLYVHGIKEDENGKKTEDFTDRSTIDWEDRFNKDILSTVGNSCFINVGLETDTENKTIYKKFLSGYDAVEYISEHLKDGDTVYIKGNIAYESDGENVYIKKKVTHISLSKAEPKDYKATFTQTVLLDSDSIGKLDKDKNTIGISAYCVDYVGKPKINGEKIEVKKNFAFPVNFEFNIGSNKEIALKQLSKYFKAKKNEIIEATVEGDIVEGTSLVSVGYDDFTDDIKELIDLGYYSEEDIKEKYAIANNNKEKRMIIKRPVITFEGKGDNKIPVISIDREKYKPNDIELYSTYLSTINTDTTDEDIEESDSDDDIDDFEALLNEI